MLIEFRVENHRSLRDEQILTLEAGRGGLDVDDRPRQVDGHAEELLTVAVLYGANASGKSNILAALAFMRVAVLDSHRSWAPEDGVPREPFAWGPKKEEPSIFEVTILVDSIRYEYGFVASDNAFLEEWLYAWPLGKKQIWYERDGDDFKFGDNLKGENKVIEEVTRSNALFLSAAVQLRHEQLSPIYTWFRGVRPVNILAGRVTHRFGTMEYRLGSLIESFGQPTLFPESPDALSTRFREMLQNADVGIIDLRVVKPDPPEDRYRRFRGRIQLRHSNSFEDAWLPLEEESKGTQTLITLTMPILQSLQEGSVLVVDELESSLHPALAQQIVRLFNSPKHNPNNAQLIFSTHDTNLLGTTLGEPALRRDQVWLTEKDPEGATVLYPLTDYKPRLSENLERGYLQGRYGAIPFLGNFQADSE